MPKPLNPGGPREFYRLEPRPIGTGGFCDVFRATDKRTGKVLAFKRLREQSPDARRRFRREIDVQSRLKHDHVMPILEVDPVSHWYVMPLAEGHLEELLPALTPDVFVETLRQVGAGLAEGHKNGFAHRDVTLRNILALRNDDGSRRWVIADWGLVRLPRGHSGTEKTEGLVGTLGFIAPEVVRDPRSANARSDIYSLGMVADVAKREAAWDSVTALDHFIRETTRIDPTRRPAAVSDALVLLRMPSERRTRHYLVWRRSVANVLETVLIGDVSGEAPKVIGRRPGLFVCDGDRLLEWRKSHHTVKLTPEPRWNGDTSAGARTIEIEDVHLVDYDSGDADLLSPVEPRTKDDSFDLGRTILPLWSAGPFLATHTFVYQDGGGAHGSENATFDAVDLRTMLSVETLFPADFAPTFPEERGKAFQRKKTSEPDWDWEEPEITSYRPLLGADGSVQLELLFTFPYSYGGSDGRWSSYSVSEIVVSKALPEDLAEVVKAPPAVSRFVHENLADAAAYGWTEVPDVPLIDSWLAIFGDRAEP